MRPRCSKHDLAVGPDGRCALCRSQDTDSQKLSLPIVLLVVLMAMAACAVVVFRVKLFLAQPESMGRDDRNAGSPSDGTSGMTSPDYSAGALPRANEHAAPGGRTASNSSTDQVEHRLLSRRDPRGFAPELTLRGELDVTGDYRVGQESYELATPWACTAASGAIRPRVGLD